MKFNYQHLLIAGASALALSAGAAKADFVINDDLIVTFSACIGNDCVNGESFGFDTLKLKENNLRIKFDDTSTSASFPNRDWQITANDSTNGGANKFSIEDITGGRTPFTIEAGASNNSLFVDDGGRIGIGTNQPVVELHMPDGDTPTIRLEQDGSSGFTPQTWDLAGNETNFFVRDVTNGSKLPLKIKPNAPTSSLFLAADGNVGMNSESPSSALHIRRTGNVSTGLRLEQNGTVAASWEILNNEATGRLTFSAGGTVPFKFAPTAVENLLRVGIDANNIVDINGALDVSGAITSASITTSGSCSVGCDAVFEADYDLPSISEHTEAMFALGYLPNVGPTFDGQQIDVADKLGRVLNELEHAHIYIAEMNERIVQLEEQLAEK